MRPLHHKMNPDGTTQPCSLWEWAAFMEKLEDRLLANDRTTHHVISTVFTGLDTQIEGPPLLFETLVTRDNPHDYWQCKHATKEDAMFCHQYVLEAIVAGRTDWKDRDAFMVCDFGEIQRDEIWVEAAAAARKFFELLGPEFL